MIHREKDEKMLIKSSLIKNEKLMKQKKHESKTLSWRILLVLLGFSLSTLAQAQNITVKGTVVDTNNDPLIGVTIAEQNTTNGTITEYRRKFFHSMCQRCNP